MNRKPRIDIRCQGCGGMFTVLLSAAHRKFCSRKCKSAAQRLKIEERVLAKIQKTPTCWLWTGTITNFGYGQIHESRSEGKRRGLAAHRWVYEHFVGPIPEGLHIDHLCKNKRCVNPAHLEPVTMAENNRRSECVSTVNARKTHCVHGHELAGDNLYVPSTGIAMQRYCRTCRALAKQRRTQWRRWLAGKTDRPVMEGR